jgi:hypothetical protein
LPLAACSGEIPLAQETKKATENTIINERTILLMVNGLRLKKLSFKLTPG